MDKKPIDERLQLPVSPETRAKTLLVQLWRSYDASGKSMGRSHEAVLLESALELLGAPDPQDVERLEKSVGELVDETRDYLSAKRAIEYGLT